MGCADPPVQGSDPCEGNDEAGEMPGCPGADDGEGYCLAWDADELDPDNLPVWQACHVSHAEGQVYANICLTNNCPNPVPVWSTGSPIDKEDLAFDVDFPELADTFEPPFPLLPPFQVGSCCTEDTLADKLAQAQGLDCAGRVCNEMYRGLQLTRSQLEISIDNPTTFESRLIASLGYYEQLMKDPEVLGHCVLSLHYEGEWVLPEAWLHSKKRGHIRPVSLEGYECQIQECHTLPEWEQELTADVYSTLKVWYIGGTLPGDEPDFTCTEAPTYDPGDGASGGNPEPPEREASPGTGNITLAGGPGGGPGPSFGGGTVRFRVDPECAFPICVFSALEMDIPLGDFDLGPYTFSQAHARLFAPAFGALEGQSVTFTEGALTFAVTTAVSAKGKGEGKLPWGLPLGDEAVTFYVTSDIESTWTFDGQTLAIDSLGVPLFLGARAELTMNPTPVHDPS